LFAQRETWPLDLQLQAADAALTVKGEATKPLKGEGFDVVFDLRGQQLSALDALFDSELPEFGPYELSGRFVNGAGTYHVREAKIGIGKHRVKANVKLVTTVTPPRVVARLHSASLNLDQLAKMLQEAEAKTTGQSKTSRVLPAFTIPRDWPKKLNLEMDIDIPDIIAEATDVGDLKTEIRLEDGHFILGPLQAKLFGGDAFGSLDLNVAKNTPAAKFKLTVRKLDYGRWLKAWAITDTVTGEVNISVDMRGSGDTLQAIFAAANGAALFISGPAHLAESDLGLWGAGITSGLMSITTSALGIKKSTEFNCMVWPFNISDGVARSDAILMDTPKITIAGSGTVDLGDEKLDILLEPARKKASIFSFQNPVRISGTLADPKRTTLGKAKTFGKLGLVILQPYFLLFTADLGTGEKNPCVAALAGEPLKAKKRRRKKKKELEQDLGLVGDLLKQLESPADQTDDSPPAAGTEQ
ncbi:MAG: AsmA-like C-terminal region-containing protein, partial [Acidiferrobacterales bacterium]|nr:AsmA-like C-terminal region-containing protein [Acidiferrobacterales bacterium]